MMDLREFLKVLEEEHELQKIKVEVDSKHELGGISKIHNERRKSPALLFGNVKGQTIPVVGQLLASDRRVALALGLSQENVFNETVQRGSNPSISKCRRLRKIVLEGELTIPAKTGDEGAFGKFCGYTRRRSGGAGRVHAAGGFAAMERIWF